ncbi:MAG: hypothetical protein ACP5N1_04540 [Candidatus Woesearchaeota archaeon]
MIYVNKFGLLKIVDESHNLMDESVDFFSKIPEETIEILDYRNSDEAKLIVK